MDLKNVIAAFFIVIIVLTLIDIRPYTTGYFINPPTNKLEAAIIVMLISIFIILAMLLPRKSSNY
jgi:hypothetical protein